MPPAVGCRPNRCDRGNRAGHPAARRIRQPAPDNKPAADRARPRLRAAAAPNVEAHLFRETLPGVKIADASRPVNTIAFDHKSQSFTLVTRVTEGGHSSVFTNPMGGRVGSSQPSGPMLRGGGSSGAGGGSRGSNGGGSSSGGGSHASSGGSASSGGGASSAGASSAGSSGGSHK